MKLSTSITTSVLVIATTASIALFGTLYSSSTSKHETSESMIEAQQPKSYIIQGADAGRLSAHVESVGGAVNKQFPIINAVSAVLTPSQAEKIKASTGVRVLDDRSVRTMSNGQQYAIDNYITTQIDANRVHDMGITGRGVTVAVVDSGSNLGGDSGQYLFGDSEGEQRIAIKYNAFKSEENYLYNDDNNGHGSHVTGIIASSLQDKSNDFNGVAPDVYLVSVKAFDENGDSSYSHILDALNWIAENQKKFQIKVVNLSLGAEAQSRYWNDPINQAVMYLWYKGVTVVTSAGNNGDELGITVPGNNPYVITVGASTYNNSPYKLDDDRVASFSAQGPTYEGFVKPDVVAPGTKVEVKVESRYFKKQLRKSSRGADYSVISGTSQSAAVVSGIAALIIQAHPGISPNDVKCKIIHSANVARNKKKYAYSPLIQGSGMVDAHAAVTSNRRGCANKGLHIKDDLNGKRHFVGPVDVKGNAWTVKLQSGKVMNHGSHWANNTAGIQGSHWSQQVIEIEGSHWANNSMQIHGSHWSNDLVATMGSHWTNGDVNMQGLDLSTELMSADSEENESNTGAVPLNPSAWQ